jgi:hypothetical protein
VNDSGENTALPDESVIVPAREAAATIGRTLAALAGAAPAPRGSLAGGTPVL